MEISIKRLSAPSRIHWTKGYKTLRMLIYTFSSFIFKKPGYVFTAMIYEFMYKQRRITHITIVYVETDILCNSSSPASQKWHILISHINRAIHVLYMLWNHISYEHYLAKIMTNLRGKATVNYTKILVKYNKNNWNSHTRLNI